MVFEKNKMTHIKIVKEKLKEIEEIKKVKSIFAEQPEVRGGMTDNPNVEDVKKWSKWYKKYHPYRKHPLDLEIKQATLKGMQIAIKSELEFLENYTLEKKEVIESISKSIVKNSEDRGFGIMLSMKDLFNKLGYGKFSIKERITDCKNALKLIEEGK